MRLRYSIALIAAALLVTGPLAARADTGFSVSLDGLQEVPPNASPATGSGTLVIDNAQTQVTYSINYSGLTGTRSAQHIHGPGAPGVPAPVVLPLSATGTTSGLVSGVAAITATVIGYMVAGTAYVNIHSSTFPGGEIRGQIQMNATPARPTTWGRIKRLYR